MKVAAATVAMQSQHAALQRQETHESLLAWVGQRSAPTGTPSHRHRDDTVRISDAGRALRVDKTQATDSSTSAADADPTLSLIRQMVEILTGKPVRTVRPEDIQSGAPAADVPQPVQNDAASVAQPAPSAGYGIAYDYHAETEEAETTSFSAQGVVKTADGREINFSLDLNMARYYRAEVNVSFRAGDAVQHDPLVINFNGNAAQLTDQHFAFDVNGDGTLDQVATLASGSGYLALDKNGNGVIDSGAELFGPASGSGFAELAGYDQDGNGWIDESDAIFSQLRVWTPTTDGKGTLASLADQNVGALYLGSTATPFQLRGSQNSNLGAVAATGLYLKEDGSAGTLQEVDLTV